MQCSVSTIPFVIAESVDPQWGPFYTAHGGLGSCSLACGGGVKTQIRDCNNPPPVDNNVLCSGNMSRESDCNTNPCPEPFGELSRCILYFIQLYTQ